MGAILFIILVGVPIGEIAVLIKVGKMIGFWETIGVVILTALIGTHLLRQQGLAILRKAQASMEENRFPVDEVFDGLCLLLAGALLLTPGFITDAAGLALFLPPFRAILRVGLLRVLAKRGSLHIHVAGQNGGMGGNRDDGIGGIGGEPFQDGTSGAGRGTGTGPIIDGDFEDVTESNDNAPKKKLPKD